MSATASKFGEAIYQAAKERLETPEGKAELKGYSPDQFLEILRQFTEVVDRLPGEYNIHSLYLVLNFLSKVVVSTMQHNSKMMEQPEGNA